ncbi:hypothetical protein CPB86DRAFT_787087 [Serendipita vermifera]|nr:hypothetical protein CPB86DRAFT_787087 [Serendipita vermifera]
MNFRSTTPVGNLNNRAGTPLTASNLNKVARDETLVLDMDENAPPDPSRTFHDDLPPEQFGRSTGRLIGSFAAPSTVSNSPKTSQTLLTPVLRAQGNLAQSAAPTLAGSVIAATPSNSSLAKPRNRVVFRGDPNLVTTFDKKVDEELYELWTAK